MRRAFEYGGFIAAAVLIIFGIGAVFMGWNAHNTVQDTLAQEQIVGTPDMTPSAIKAEAQKAGLDVSSLSIPSDSVANLPIDSGDRAHTFAGYMRIHALEASGGLTYAEMGRFVSAANPDDPAGTSDEAAAAKDENGQPVSNGARNIWVTETALTTALNTSFFAERVGIFTLAIGGALLLTGIGFLVLMLGGALRPTPAETPAASQARPSVQPASA